MSDTRYKHSIEVAKSAVKLAKKFGADPKKAQISGLLHDIMKEEKNNIQLDMMKNSNLNIDEITLNSKKLWHQVTGMIYSRDVLGIDDEDILNAIRYHTSARKNMSILEKVVYIADYISDDRDYKGVNDMRIYANRSLDEALVNALIFTISELTENKRTICTDTIDAYNFTVSEI